MKIKKNSVSDKRKTILDAALNLISEQGFHGAAMSRLAKEAGVSVGIIYHYFQNKDQLINELYKEIFREFAESLSKLHDPTLPLKTQILQLWRAMVRYYLKNPTIVSYVQQFKNSPYFTPEIDAETDRYFVFLFQLGEEAVRENIIKDLPRPVIYALCLDFAGTLSQKHAKGILDLTDELIEQIIDTTWDAIKR